MNIDQSYQPTVGEGAVVGHIWGSLVGLAVAVASIPVTTSAGVFATVGALTAGTLGGGVLGANERCLTD